MRIRYPYYVDLAIGQRVRQFFRGKIGFVCAVDISSLRHVQPPDPHWLQNIPQPEVNSA